MRASEADASENTEEANVRGSRFFLLVVSCMLLAVACRAASDVRSPRAESTAARLADSAAARPIDSGAVRSTEPPAASVAAADSSTRVRITRDSIGGVPLWVPLAEIGQRVARTEKWSFPGYEFSYPGLRFTVGGLEILAVQELDSEREDTIPDLELTRPADFYDIRGGTGVLPGGATTGSSWAELRRALGPVVVFAFEEPDDTLRVRPCRYNWLSIGLPRRPGIKPRQDHTVDPDAVGAAATPLFVQLRRAWGDTTRPLPRCAEP